MTEPAARPARRRGRPAAVSRVAIGGLSVSAGLAMVTVMALEQGAGDSGQPAVEPATPAIVAPVATASPTVPPATVVVVRRHHLPAPVASPNSGAGASTGRSAARTSGTSSRSTSGSVFSSPAAPATPSVAPAAPAPRPRTPSAPAPAPAAKSRAS